jgi:hypothetical protein
LVGTCCQEEEEEDISIELLIDSKTKNAARRPSSGRIQGMPELSCMVGGGFIKYAIDAVLTYMHVLVLVLVGTSGCVIG